jgi:bifunctional non-homologous end joining protein LigD
VADPFPTQLAPMLATAVTMLPQDDEQWLYEFKWDGVRLLAYRWPDGRLRLESRTRADVTARYPELLGLADSLPTAAVLDGELVALGPDGRPSFGLVQQRLGLTNAHVAAARAADVPVIFFAFDVLYLDDRSYLSAPLAQRRTLLESLRLAGPAWRTPPAFAGEGAATLAAAGEQRLEGVVAKHLDSRYEPGRRSRLWRKVKLVERAEFVIGGWVPGEGRRGGTVGALVMGAHDAAGRLRYRGRVGTGFTDAELDRLSALLLPLTRTSSPFADTVPRPPGSRDAVRFVEPVLVAEVAYRELTTGGTLRQASYLGLRHDKPAIEVAEVGVESDVVRESEATTAGEATAEVEDTVDLRPQRRPPAP